MASSGPIQSSFLNSFLSKKRTCEVTKFEERETFDDVYIRQFLSTETESRKSKLKEVQPSHVEDQFRDDLPRNNEGMESNSLSIETQVVGIESKDESQISYSRDIENDSDSSSDVNEESMVEESKSTTVPVVRLSNLPFKASEREIIEFAAKYNIKFISVTIIMDKRRIGLPSGNATATLSSINQVDEAISTLHNESFQGRDIRVSIDEKAKRTFLSMGNSSRYFGLLNDISLKCLNCGEVGHRQTECKNTDIMQPCHLCAGRDHDPGDCPNLTCFRCGRFGHHSRNCSFARASKPVLCTKCGSMTHGTMQCLQLNSSYSTNADSKGIFESPLIRCMACLEIGHSLCAKVQPIPNPGKLFCPNCGRMDHHVDYPHASKRKNDVCLAPRIDAFLKFPRSITVEDIDDEVHSQQDLEMYYRTIARQNKLYTDQAEDLFPLLQHQRFNPVAQYDNYRNEDSKRSNSSGHRRIEIESESGEDMDVEREVRPLKRKRDESPPRSSGKGRSNFAQLQDRLRLGEMRHSERGRREYNSYDEDYSSNRAYSNGTNRRDRKNGNGNYRNGIRYN